MPFVIRWLLVLTVLIVMSMIPHSATNSDLNNPLDNLDTFNWDLAVSQGNGAVLLSISNAASLQFTFPMPKVQPNRNRSQPMSVVSLDGDLENVAKVNSVSTLKYEELEREWPHFEVKSIISDASKNLLYFSHTMKLRNHKVTNLCIFNFNSRETRLLLQTFSASIDDLHLLNGTIYFISSTATEQSIMKLKTTRESFVDDKVHLPVVVKKFDLNILLTGFSLTLNGTIYWSSTNPSTISYHKEDKDEVFLSSDLKKAHALSIFGDQLYFINTPQFGPEKTIERVSLSNPSIRDTVINFEAHNQIPGTFTLVCGMIYWTDAISKALWKTPLPVHNSMTPENAVFTKVYSSAKVNRHFGISSPYAVTPRRFLDQALCDSITRKLNFANSSKNESSSTKPLAALTTEPRNPIAPTPNSELYGKKLEFCSTQENQESCFNGGTCVFLESNFYCLCQPGFAGPWCEVQWDEDTANPSANQVNWVSPEGEVGENSQNCSSTRFLLLISSGLSGLVVALIVFIILLIIKIRRLSCNPKIHRRVIVSRPDVTRSRISAVNTCEMIDIENCCNMTICETPCYDSGTGKVSIVKGSKIGQEDKERLLDF